MAQRKPPEESLVRAPNFAKFRISSCMRIHGCAWACAHACEGAEAGFFDGIVWVDETRKELTAEAQRSRRRPEIAN